MTSLLARDGYYVAYAICANSGGTDLTAWDNAQAALIVGELNAMDWFYSANITHTKPKTRNINPMTAGHYPKRIQTGRYRGVLSTTHYLQTGILTYAVMGACTTTEATPNTHAITKQTDEDPIFLAFHYEKEGTNSNRRKDIMGFVPLGLDITVSEQDTIAMQTFNGEFAFTGAGSDLAQPTALTQAAHAPYTWFNYKNASGASAFTYNSGAINVDIISAEMHIGWSGTLFGTYDNDGYPTEGWIVPPFDSYVTLSVRSTDAAGTAIETISDLAHGSYAGDLDFICDFYESATRYLKFTWDKMYIDPESLVEEFRDEGSWFDGLTFTLRFKDENSSLAVEEKNALNNDYYENPA